MGRFAYSLSGGLERRRPNEGQTLIRLDSDLRDWFHVDEVKSRSSLKDI